MYACIAIMNGRKWRSSFFHTLHEAIQYAERMSGVVEVENVSTQKVVWTREKGLLE